MKLCLFFNLRSTKFSEIALLNHYYLNTGQKNNPLHGKTLEAILNHLVAYYGWEQLGYNINIRCFNENPSIKSSLKFLRATPWARQKVEELYISTLDNR